MRLFCQDGLGNLHLIEIKFYYCWWWRFYNGYGGSTGKSIDRV